MIYYLIYKKETDVSIDEPEISWMFFVVMGYKIIQWFHDLLQRKGNDQS